MEMKVVRSTVNMRSAVASAFLTLALFLVMPFVDLLSSVQDGKYLVVPADTVQLPAAPPPVRKIERTVEQSRPKPSPELSKMRRRLMPVSAGMNLELAMGDIVGDFDISFRVAGPDISAIGKMIFDVNEIDTPPRPVARLRPVYPPHARMRGVEGYVVMEFTVGADGQTTDFVIVSSVPDDVFERAAEMAVKRWRFNPGSKDGQPVSVRMKQKIRFELVE